MFHLLKIKKVMKKGWLIGLAALAVGVVVVTLGGKKAKPSLNQNLPYSYK